MMYACSLYLKSYQVNNNTQGDFVVLETLSLGGGIIYIKDQFDVGAYYDLGFCPEFNISVNSTQEYKEEYFADASGAIIKVPSTIGVTTSLLVNGTFVCESLTRKLLQTIWFQGNVTDAGTELSGGTSLTPKVKAVKFVSSSNTGPDYCVILPTVSLSVPSTISFISNEWKTVSFEFTVLYAENIRTVPTLRVQEEGETLANFCV